MSCSAASPTTGSRCGYQSSTAWRGSGLSPWRSRRSAERAGDEELHAFAALIAELVLTKDAYGDLFHQVRRRQRTGALRVWLQVWSTGPVGASGGRVWLVVRIGADGEQGDVVVAGVGGHPG